ncbi:hypothetical protein ALT_4130 [Aspergillus lentulus]|uniref:TEL2-interacting protein 1 n=1 Tax=Aspergillus lentulus TaxID=293939 RepID=A0AAN4PHQ2_ASPLE|nr:hypothetical protein CNMCM8060_000674 [Aspergillus lentulus]KAF4184957.1 hypothetical protein CNMCM7927_007218 [Aspergillus lentulus]KAF4198301.1 hypothetical protein CNMCM8694_000419 [Aspergillus lentulus]GAQ06809.1 hypothetical protein ALT_4130 [Aspergillus lentulus]GFG02388.1 hypothetical protein IFM61392_02269 [Aspergillus lentulus]
METLRQESFKKLRAPCVELSSVGLGFRGRQKTPNDVFQALSPVYNVLTQLADKDALDEKLAEYAFFPLSHIFNETQSLPARTLELAVNCLRILIAKGWRRHLSPQLGKQLIILLTLIVGGAPNKASGGQSLHSQPVELGIACFNCFAAIFSVLEGPVAKQTIYHEIGTATIVDQAVYILLEGVSDGPSDESCVAAAEALRALFDRITDRVVLASIMPRTVSALTKVLKPTTQIRRSFRVLSICLQILTNLLRNVLNDQVTSSVTEESNQTQQADNQQADDRVVLDGSWLKATTTQIRLALANVIQIRRHERQEVQAALLDLCSMVIEDCSATLHDSISLMVETIVILSISEDQTPNHAYTTLKHLATTYPVVLDTLKDSLHTWVTAFPRTMQGNDETAKQWGIKQISTAFQVLSQVQSGSDILTSALASGLCDSVAAAVNQASRNPQPVNQDMVENLNLDVLHRDNQSLAFSSVLLGHRSQQQTLKDLQSMIVRLNSSESGSEITRSILGQVHRASGDAVVAPFWLALNFLKTGSQLTGILDDFISLDHIEISVHSLSSRAMIEELYYYSLPLLDQPLSETSRDWRISALALEAVALQAQQLGEAFRPELMDALYPVLQLLASNNSNLQRHAMVCLDILTSSCRYEDTSTMIIENVDYLVNSVALKLNTFDVSPYPPQVLFMMVKLCGARLIPYLDDLVDSMFGILDMYHGYPKLVETMFKTLAAIVEEGTKTPSLLAITNGEATAVDHRKRQYQRLLVSTLAEDLAARRTKRAKYMDEDVEDDEERVSHPKRPWKSESEKVASLDADNLSDILNADESEEPLPPPREPEDEEKPLSKSHTILLHIVKSIPSHLTSPSPYLRRSLLSVLIQGFPALAQNENSFLPVINDLWPAIASKISFPSSLSSETSSSALMTRDRSTPSTSALRSSSARKIEEFDFKEETFVGTAACEAIEVMCKTAGDFMASRVEAEFPRWERIYRRTWDKVRQDAEKALERRAHHQSSNTHSSETHTPAEIQLSLPLSHSLSLVIPGSSSSSSSTTGARAFTPHHTLWRALISLFITLLTHVRLPLSTGDQICEFLADWITLYVGPNYYTQFHLQDATSASDIPAAQRAELEPVETAIQAMETWNADLTWFIFQQRKAQAIATSTRSKAGDGVSMICEIPENPLESWSSLANRLRFTPVVF